MYKWSPTSWQRFPCEQSINYPDTRHLLRVISELEHLPPLVSDLEIIHLKKALTLAGRQNAFILHAGDCAETFQDCRPDIVIKKLNTILQMSDILSREINKPIVQIGRIAGQYTKPRSMEFETIQGASLPSYRGDLVNSFQFDVYSRMPDPQRMLQGYNCAANILNWIKIKFRKLDSCENPNPLNFFSSHEALNLYYEQALTRQVKGWGWYNLSTHLPWIGMRTAKPGTAHVELLKGIQNPIGIKVGTSMSPKSLIELIQLLNPNYEEGKLLLITRLGAHAIDQYLPPLIKAVQAIQCPVVWSCDPMHGNTKVTDQGIKTRYFDTILLELKRAFKIHQAMSSCLSGVHLELTGEEVTECIGGVDGPTETDLKSAYKSLVDPRLNGKQSLEMANRLSQLISEKEIV